MWSSFARALPRLSASFPRHSCAIGPAVLAGHISSTNQHQPKLSAAFTEEDRHADGAQRPASEVRAIDQVGRVCDAYLHDKGETPLSLTVVAAAYTVLMPLLLSAAEGTEGCEVTVDAHPIGFYRVDVRGTEKHNHKNRIHVAVTGHLKDEFVHEHRENSASFNVGGGYTN
ncbi:unnamed protein product [Vitrella brassicaformis CCMP3155]|uniref:Uncharacterized protein n=1 Tax=Vitrella brassicaformis (strain CCMP3155) TaxID=1169540 RepID=A0A0G4EMY4_VITBC|nr:unnamed protein product [Vitrella brassicaformis CCMP3155]|eukprot:CEL98345.1 unnamed protein product [Vitrella brassicaformis CCMP3155]